MDTDLPRGVIEGFFGQPWGWPARLSAIDFLRDYGFGFYIYAPKGDAYLRRKWREPMPRETLDQLARLGARCLDRGIDFGIGLTPFEIYQNYDGSARDCLRSKVLQINDTGADTLAILFDDMRGDVEGIAEMQARVIDEVCGMSTARRFIVCPTYYSYDPRLAREFGAPPQAYLRISDGSSTRASIASGPARKSSRTNTPPGISARSPPISDASLSSGTITSPTTRRVAPIICISIHP